MKIAFWICCFMGVMGMVYVPIIYDTLGQAWAILALVCQFGSALVELLLAVYLKGEVV